jgi:hypothetical protein
MASSETVICPYCQTTVTKRGLAHHQSNNVQCCRNQRIALLVEQDYVPCHPGSPIFQFLKFHFEYNHTGTLWLYDEEVGRRPWVPLWLAELWYRASKSPVTGRLDCNHGEFLSSMKAVQESDRKQGAMAAMAKMRDIGYFGEYGDIFKVDMTSYIYRVRESQAELSGSLQDYQNAADGLKQEERPFERRIREGPRLS